MVQLAFPIFNQVNSFYFLICLTFLKAKVLMIKKLRIDETREYSAAFKDVFPIVIQKALKKTAHPPLP